MHIDLENIIETHSTRLLQHLALCVHLGHKMTQGETKNLIRFHVRNAVTATEDALALHRSSVYTEKENVP